MITQSGCTAMPGEDEACIASDLSAVASAGDTAKDPNAAPDDRFLSAAELATLIHVDASTLRRWRTSTPPTGPAFTRLSPRVVVYSIGDVRQWIALRRIDPAGAA